MAATTHTTSQEVLRGEAEFSVENRCRLYPDSTLIPILDLGAQPPANSLRGDVSERLPSIPLTIAWSEAAKCIQLTATVNPDYLFRHYVWVTGTSETARRYSEQFFRQIQERVGRSFGQVLEVASNDGTFLRPFKQAGWKVIGVDPAKNIADKATAEEIPTLSEFFGIDIAQTINESHGAFDAVFARNVLPHVPYPRDIVRGMSELLSSDGVGAIEFHYAGKILEELHYDSVYHEHFFYYTLTTLVQLLREEGLSAFDLTESPISGGSYVLYFSRTERAQTEALRVAIANENERGINTIERWQEFARRCEDHRVKLQAILKEEETAGRKMIGYGASARSSTLLNYCGITNALLQAVADQSAYKHGLFTPGTDIPILSPSDALALRPDTIVLLAWNFKDEIVRIVREQYGFKGRIVLPLPGDPQVIDDHEIH